MLMLFGTLVFLKGPLQGKELILFFRFLFLTAIFLYFTENYLDLSYDLLASGDVFSKPVEGQSLVLFGIPRMLGPFWDFRIQGIFGVLYLLIAIVSPDYKFKKIDIIIASLAVILSMSRGAMVLWACVILGASLYHSKTLPSVVFRLLGLFLVGVISIVSYSMFGGDEAKKTLSSFNILSEDGNALSQRGGFKDYSINSFFENPLGRGIGFLKSDLIDRNVLVGEVYYKKVSDAFIYIQMAEVGFLGFIFFILSLFELLFKRTMFGLMFLVGFLIQMTGTDVPDMGVHYFVILLLATAFLPERTVLRQE
ncbi:MAG TPA: hypothetical protein VL129_05850 [Pseudomonas sp.]|uniref:hypothetical protein n=1 Tax=Pseudomonas sp. TaxID=306 RepID=UPI002CD688D4|nr:hypothetical protein [Pseudomonas sp.]HTO18656.1 hypothetical protein [Pseudomonas sp.]